MTASSPASVSVVPRASCGPPGPCGCRDTGVTPRHSPRSSSLSVSNPSSSSAPPPPPSPSGGTSRRKICLAREHFLALTPQTSSCRPLTYWGSSSWSWRREGGTTSPTSLGRSYCRRRVSVLLWSEINTAPPRQVIFSNSVGQLSIHSNAFQSIPINIKDAKIRRHLVIEFNIF